MKHNIIQEIFFSLKDWLAGSGHPVNFIKPSNRSLFQFAEMSIAHLKALGRNRTAETYSTSLSSFRRFRKNQDILLEDIDSDLMAAFEAYLRKKGVSPNSSSFYMRNLRAIYNKAVEKKLTTQKYPFKHVYTGVEKTAKRAISLGSIRKIKALDLSSKPHLEFARDMFLFSFYTRGMSFIDMAYLRKRDLHSGILSYRRQKTGQQLFVKWDPCMQEIVDRYGVTDSPHLLPIIDPNSDKDERQQYLYAGHNINRNLKIIGFLAELHIPLTMYVSRHTWASIAKSKNIPISVISESMGHDSEATTRIYLTALDSHAIDEANDIILKSL